MRELLSEIESWRQAGHRVALATVVRAWGSAPRPLGAQMAVSSGGEVDGSVSGGCVEGAVYEEAREVLETGRPKLVSYGVSQETAWSVGLSCGGTIEVWIEPLEDAFYAPLKDALDGERGIARAVVLGPEGRAGEWYLADEEPQEDALGAIAAQDLAAQWLADQKPQRLEVEAGGETLDVFVQVHPPRRKLIVVGAVHVAVPLVRFARELGFRTYVVDPRTVFATPERFGHADEVLTDWPDEALRKIGLNASSYLALLSHDLKLDVPALREALPSAARYIGALGSRQTHARRCAALREEGVPEDAIAGIHNPIGLDLGGRRAEEMAVSILAEIVAVSHGRDLRRPAARVA